MKPSQKTKNKWLILDIGDGWKSILPDGDIKPHSTDFIDEKTTEVEVADIMCPCHPQVDMENRMIIHNAFKELKNLEK